MDTASNALTGRHLDLTGCATADGTEASREARHSPLGGHPVAVGGCEGMMCLVEEIKLRPALWYLAASVVFTAVGCIAVKLVWTGFPTAVIVIAPLGGALGAYSTLSLKIAPAGVEVARRTAAWDELVLQQGRWGASLRTAPGSVPRAQQVNAFLPMYEPGWRHGRIGRAVATWAPQLLEEADGAP